MDNLFSSIQIVSSGLKAQSERIKIETQNLANKDSIALSSNGMPYLRKVIFFKKYFDKKIGAETVKISKRSVDTSTPLKPRFDPNNPLANEKGYVLYPNVDTAIAMSDFKEAKNSYQFNLNALTQSINMLNRTLSILSNKN